MTKPLGKLAAGCAEFPLLCDVCGKSRGHGDHKKCSRIRQKRYAQILVSDLNDPEFLKAVCTPSKKETDHDSPIFLPATDAHADQR